MMLTDAQLHGIFERVRKLSSHDEVEVLISAGTHALTRFANNHIHQNVSDDSLAISVRVAFDGKTARVTTNQTDDESLRRTVKSAEELTAIQQPNPDLLPMAAEPANRTQPPSRFFDATANATPAQRAAEVEKVVAVARKRSLVTAGIFSTGHSVQAIFNSRGLAATHRETSSTISITMLAADSSGWQKANSPDVTQLNAARLAEVAAQKAADSARPHELPPGKYTVVLEPSAVQDLTGFMFWDFGAQPLLDERSFLNNRIGKKLFGENITIWDDAYHAQQSGAPFDGEGVPRQRVPLVENGVVRNVVFARSSAEKMKHSAHGAQFPGAQATGHGFPLPNDMGDAPMNIVFSSSGAAHTSEQMVSSIERGILVTRLWYIREVEPYEKILTGMTRDGTFLIENGRVTRGIRNFRFNQSVVEMLQKVDAMSMPARTSGEESFEMVVPAMKVRDFNFTEVTKF